jgi:hypothetical protein
MSNGRFQPYQRVITDDQLAACPAGARVIPLTNGFVAWVDDEDYERLVRHTWGIHRKLNQVRAVRNNNRRPRLLYMHREVLGLIAGDGTQVDHIRHRTAEGILDNRRLNLRIATPAQNSANKVKMPGKFSSQYKGVTFYKPSGTWVAGVQVNRKRRFLGYFPTEALAARAYDIAALKHFGEFATTNFRHDGATQWLFGPGGIQEVAP